MPDLVPTPSMINEARIIESRVYIERRAIIAPHRKMVLKIRERPGNCFWLMLERKPTSGLALIKGLGVTPNNDLGQISRNEGLEHVIDTRKYRLENKQVFEETVTLYGLSVIVQALGEILVHYKLFSVNCWAFCAILQHELGWKSSPFIQFGAMLEHKMYTTARRKVHTRLEELSCIKDPFMLPTQLALLADNVDVDEVHRVRARNAKVGVSHFGDFEGITLKHMIRKKYLDTWLLAAPTDPQSSFLLPSLCLWDVLYPTSRGQSFNPMLRDVLIAAGSSIIIMLRGLEKSEGDLYIEALAVFLALYGRLLRCLSDYDDRLSQAGESFEEEAMSLRPRIPPWKTRMLHLLEAPSDFHIFRTTMRVGLVSTIS